MNQASPLCMRSTRLVWDLSPLTDFSSNSLGVLVLSDETLCALDSALQFCFPSPSLGMKTRDYLMNVSERERERYYSVFLLYRECQMC